MTSEVAGEKALRSTPGSRPMRRGGAGRTIARAYRDTMLLCMRRGQDMDVATLASVAERPRDEDEMGGWEGRRVRGMARKSRTRRAGGLRAEAFVVMAGRGKELKVSAGATLKTPGGGGDVTLVGREPL